MSRAVAAVTAILDKKKVFTADDLQSSGSFSDPEMTMLVQRFTLRVTNTDDLIYAPLWYHEQGLQQTASGYGKKLATPNMINYENRLYRIYYTCFSNTSTEWFKVRGREIVVQRY